MISRRHMLATCSLLPLAGISGLVHAKGIKVLFVSGELVSDKTAKTPQLLLQTRWQFSLPNSLVDCLRRGIALYVVYECRFLRKRRFLPDEQIFTTSLVKRLGFSPLSHQYRLSQGGYSHSFESFDAAWDEMQQISNWPVADLTEIASLADIDCQTRIRLDLSQLPRAIQLGMKISQDWELDCPWKSVSLKRISGSDK